MSNIQVTVEAINNMQPLDIVKNEIIKQRFIQIHDTLWGEGTGCGAYERESIWFNRLLADKPELQKATKFSIFTAFIDLAVCGLSLEPGVRALCYLQGRNYATGETYTGQDGRQKKRYEGRLVLTVSGYGELVLRERTGQIRHADNPVVVYEDDDFSFTDTDGRKSVSYTCHLPHKSNHIVACFLRITRTDGTTDYGVMFEEDWLRLQSYSAKNNKRWDESTRTYKETPNELYTVNEGTIDKGFLMAKCIKHAFKTYPKVRIGRATQLETEEQDKPQETDWYGTGTEERKEQPAISYDKTTAPYGNPANDMAQGVSVAQAEAEDDGAF